MVGKIFIIAAPSGAGKSTLVAGVLPLLQDKIVIERVITYTTRQPRSYEKNGSDYHFITEQEFRSKIEQGFFIEWSTAYGMYYGSPRSILEKMEKGVSSLMILDRQGASFFLQHVPQAIPLWITVACKEVLKERLTQRASETVQERERRYLRACKEFEDEQKNPLFLNVVKNDDLYRSIQHIHDFIMSCF